MQSAKLRRDERQLCSAPILVGDIAPNCALPNLNGETIDLRADSVAGNTIVLIFCPKFNDATQRLLAAFRTNLALFQAAGARLFAISRAPASTVAEEAIPFPVLVDREGQSFRDFGANLHGTPTTIVLRSNHHVSAIFDGLPAEQTSGALSVSERLAKERQTAIMGMHPPVLIIPQVFSKSGCKRLIKVVDTRGQRFMDPGPGLDYLGTDYKMRIPEHMREDRIDHWIFDKDTLEFLKHRLQRVWPEIRKAFQYNVTKYESFRIGCYQGSRGGYLHGHRDNIPPMTYRRFAMSINLNAEEFEGGELRFSEFGDQRYRPETGTAIVLSSSLLHEALHVTAGRRLVFLAFLFGNH
ncbi:MAG: redoxin domain-containing protein [Rhodomicrobium sp.]